MRLGRLRGPLMRRFPAPKPDEPVFAYVSDFGEVEFKGPLPVVAQVRAMEEDINRWAHKRWLAGEDPPYRWPNG